MNPKTYSMLVGAFGALSGNALVQGQWARAIVDFGFMSYFALRGLYKEGKL